MALHITNGDATVPELLATGLMDAVLPWRDALHEGPVPDVGDEELRRVRGAFLAGEGAYELAARDRLVEEQREGEFVLWFEADLYDQLQLVQILARLRSLGVEAEAITLVCIGEHPGFARFGGLGELNAGQLARLPDAAGVTLTDAALAYADRAWRALRASDPTGLAEVVASRSAELRFVAEAFDRLGREYPSTRDGLSLTERRLLAAVAGGAETAGDAFVRGAARETRPFLGDTWAFDRLARIAGGDAPLVAAEPLRITATGGRVLAGDADHVALNGIDRWIGGVHLHGREVPWRFDEGHEAVCAVL